ncbi:uncharacterized protein SOCE836_038770 [Sorangium cellulosum]|uniref:Uncharacterized protein n=1 Tax=Sorangium cellulosum TaxID=56 RepID=A0A4P2QP68_SORCE|nr:uncharacterized protein SOCE836_038770 [Sorangium cellulosum]WCQ91124.1 hypothetical protein NQZ70_03839 [Sorangium sp. Soce836]
MAVNRLLGTGPGRARRRLARPRWPCVTLHEGQLFPASGIEEPLVLCMVSIPPPACRHPAPDRKRSSGMARVFDCGSAESPPIWCRPQHRGAPRQDHPGADAPSEAEDQPITAVQASKGLTHRNIESNSLPCIPALPRSALPRSALPRSALPRTHAALPRGHAARRARSGPTGRRALGGMRGAQRAQRARGRERLRRSVSAAAERNRGEHGRGGPRRGELRRRSSTLARAGYTCTNQLGSSASGSAVARTASIASISSFVCTPLRRMAAGPSPAGTTTDSTASAVSTP